MRKFFLLLLGVMHWTFGLSCTCSHKGNFIKASQQIELIVVIKVTAHNDLIVLTGAAPSPISMPLSATVEIIEVLKGTEERKTIKIFGDNGMLCRPYMSNFEIGKYYVIGLSKCKNAESRNGVMETSQDYFVSICGEYWLNYDSENGKVFGFVEENKSKLSEYPFDEFKKLIK